MKARQEAGGRRQEDYNPILKSDLVSYPKQHGSHCKPMEVRKIKGFSYLTDRKSAYTLTTTNTPLSDRWLPTLPSENFPPSSALNNPFPALAGNSTTLR